MYRWCVKVVLSDDAVLPDGDEYQDINEVIDYMEEDYNDCD